MLFHHFLKFDSPYPPYSFIIWKRAAWTFIKTSSLLSIWWKEVKVFGKTLHWENDDRIVIFKPTTHITHNRLLSEGFSVQEGLIFWDINIQLRPFCMRARHLHTILLICSVTMAIVKDSLCIQLNWTEIGTSSIRNKDLAANQASPTQKRV